MTPINIHWFRRDLRLEDNAALFHALESDEPVIPLFIFDEHILDELPEDDARVNFLHETLTSMHEELGRSGSGMLVIKGKPEEVWRRLIDHYEIAGVYTNRDYEPYALERDQGISELLESRNIPFHTFKDQVIFEMDEVLKDDGGSYTVYTPYSRKWFSQFQEEMIEPFPSHERLEGFHSFEKRPQLPSLADIGFTPSAIRVPPYVLAESKIKDYQKTRNFPAVPGTSKLGPHLRFGTISVRQAFKETMTVSHTFAKELVWREFFMQILYHFPHVVKGSFRPKYDRVPWRNDEEDFKAWCEGRTGYPLVDAGMRELNQTGFMHNRVRMLVASFLTKHLLIDWRWGEAYFAKKLLDFELSSNNGNWQWAAGSGCDASPYFRVFNPMTQIQKFDKQEQYIRKWVPELESDNYPEPIVEHRFGRERAISTFKEALANA